jgi:hypothetical protein
MACILLLSNCSPNKRSCSLLIFQIIQQNLRGVEFMKTTIFTSRLARLVLAGLVLYQPFVTLQAATITVCDSGCDQAGVQAAIDVANPGDTVQLDSGIYHVNLNIDKNVILQGQGAGQTLLDGSRIGYVVFINQSGIVELNNLTIQNGTTPADSGTGGGIYNRGKLKIAKCIIKDNAATKYTGGGGGILNEGDLNIQYTTLSENTARYTGGAISNYGNLNIQHTIISGNTSTVGAGTAIANTGGNVQITYSAIVNNLSQSSLQSIAVLNNAPPGSNLGIFQSTISENGGTAIVNSDKGNVLLSSTTIKNDTVPYPTLIFKNGGVLRILNSIVVSPSGTPNCDTEASSVALIDSKGGNVASDASCQLNDPTDQQNNTHINLGPLQVNAPGTIPTHALLLGSAAIDTLIGTTGLHTCAANLLIDDQRGVSRPQGAGCDSGAYELRIPMARDDNYVAVQGQTFVQQTNLLANDDSPEGLKLTLSSASGVAHGAFFQAFTAGGFQYKPTQDFIGQDSFTYTVSDGVHTSEAATVTINVQPANHPPIALNDSYIGFAGQDLKILPINGVLGNDSDPDGNPLSVVSDFPPEQGTLDMGGDGSFTYTPNPGFTGTDTFTYKASDGQAYSYVATVTIKVKPYLSTITIVEDVQPDSPANFKFTGDLGKFVLDNPATDDGDVYGNSKTFDVQPGTYSISQIKAAGWFTGSSSCNPVANTIADSSLNNIQVTINGGENITCTFVNQRPGRLSVKAFNDLNRNQRRNVGEPWLANWEIQLYVYSPSETPLTQWTNATGQAVFGNLKSGNYTVCEVLQPNWNNLTPLGLDLIFGAPCYPVQVKPGQTTSVLFGNTSVL